MSVTAVLVHQPNSSASLASQNSQEFDGIWIENNTSSSPRSRSVSVRGRSESLDAANHFFRNYIAIENTASEITKKLVKDPAFSDTVQQEQLMDKMKNQFERLFTHSSKSENSNVVTYHNAYKSRACQTIDALIYKLQNIKENVIKDPYITPEAQESSKPIRRTDDDNAKIKIGRLNSECNPSIWEKVKRKENNDGYASTDSTSPPTPSADELKDGFEKLST